jgi:hypothetical protein
MATPEKPNMRSIGGSIPEDLYWEFKQAQVARRESTTKALEVAIRLYLDAVPEESQNKEDHHG